MDKTIAIMQPYLFPYIGYFQLIHAVDLFVIYDDAQWMQQSWINRNRILCQGTPKFITFPVEKGNFQGAINRRLFAAQFDRNVRKIKSQIEQGYRRSSEYEQTMPLVRRCLGFQSKEVLAFVINSLREFCAHLDIRTPFLLSSYLEIDPSLRGQERVIAMNTLLGASSYINPIGGIELYNPAVFRKAGIDLRFLKSRVASYHQPGATEFIPFLSIIDVLMNNPVERVREMLNEYDLIDGTNE